MKVKIRVFDNRLKVWVKLEHIGYPNVEWLQEQKFYDGKQLQPEYIVYFDLIP